MRTGTRGCWRRCGGRSTRRPPSPARRPWSAPGTRGLPRAERTGGASPDPQYGWGLIDPGVSVTRVIPDEGRVAAPPAPVRGPGLVAGPRMAAIGIIAVVSLATVILLMLRLRWIIRPSTASPRPATAAGEEPTPAGAVVTRIGAGTAVHCGRCAANRAGADLDRIGRRQVGPRHPDSRCGPAHTGRAGRVGRGTAGPEHGRAGQW